MASLHLVLMILAVICFLLSALGVAWSPEPARWVRGNLIGAGLFFWALATVIT